MAFIKDSMSGVVIWLRDNWFSLVQLFCLVGGFVFAAKAWRIQFLAALAEKHRCVWEKIMDKPQLHRIFAKEVNILTKPITPGEESALYIILVQYETGWEMAEFLDRKRLPALANDIGIFFQHPLVRAIWEKYQGSYDKRDRVKS